MLQSFSLTYTIAAINASPSTFRKLHHINNISLSFFVTSDCLPSTILSFLLPSADCKTNSSQSCVLSNHILCRYLSCSGFLRTFVSDRRMLWGNDHILGPLCFCYATGQTFCLLQVLFIHQRFRVNPCDLIRVFGIDV